MRRVFAALFLVFACSLAASAASRTKPKPETAPAAAAEIPHCKGADDCEVKWGRALVWANTHLNYPVARATRNLIQTSGPAKYSVNPSVSIARTRNPDGSYSFVLQAFCANLFGCRPELPEMRHDFLNFVEAGFEGQ